MAPLIKKIALASGLTPSVYVTAQHREMLDEVLEVFEIKADFDLDLMRPRQDLFSLTSGILNGLKDVFTADKPDMVLVHGDTTTSVVAAQAAFYLKIPIGHVEAGLRTYNKYSPFPEEMNRTLIGSLADLHFAPTQINFDNLLKENIPKSNVFLTGNTIVDALHWVLDKKEEAALPNGVDLSAKTVLLTTHRRENFGQPLVRIFKAILEASARHPEFQIVYPVHPNPQVSRVAYEMLSGQKGILLIDPVTYPTLLSLMKRSQFVITDSGGIQEEAPCLAKPVIVLRESTERPEAVMKGAAHLAGSHDSVILETFSRLTCEREVTYQNAQKVSQVYGDGNACGKIIGAIDGYFAHVT